jgi:hypothetical protein
MWMMTFAGLAGDLDYSDTYGYGRAHATYATRRMWRVFTVRP